MSGGARDPGDRPASLFSAATRAIQTARGSRAAYARVDQRGWPSTITDELAGFIAAQTSCFLATASADGQPYVQHRGGPPGFLRVLDPHTIAFADYRGNRQYITTGNLGENPKVLLFLIDYAQQARIKIWGTARVIDPDPALMPAGYAARQEQAIAITVTAWDANCPQHIPRLGDAAAYEAKIAALEAEVARLRAATC